MRKYRLLTFFFGLLLLKASAQKDSSFAIQLTSFKNVQYIVSVAGIFIDTNKNVLPQQLNEKMFRVYKSFPEKKIPKKFLIDSRIYILLKIKNDTNVERSLALTPGTYAIKSKFYKRDSITDKWIEVNEVKPKVKHEGDFHYFSLYPGEEIELLIGSCYARTNIIFFDPYLIEPGFIEYHLNYLNRQTAGVDVFTYIVCGLLLMMVFFSLVNYLQNHKREFLFYSLYAFFFGVMLLLKALNYKVSSAFGFFNEEYFDYFLQIGGYVFYVLFSRMFLNMPVYYPLLNKLFILAEIVLIAFLLTFSFFYFAGFSYSYLSVTENASKYFFIFLGIMYLVLGIANRNTLMNFLLAGNLANLFFGAISMLLVLFPYPPFLKNEFFRQALTYFELGILIELILFMAGLAYKNKIELIEKVKMRETIKAENEKREYEKQIAVLEAQRDERSRISADMHDDLGSGVTAIRLLSEIAIKKTRENPVEEISKISNNANELMGKMNAIIWSMNHSNDTVSSLVTYIRSYASEYLDNFNLDYHMHIPPNLPDTEIAGEKRRNVFLVVKETLNNIMKHSGATDVDIKVSCDNQLTIVIKDNGKGIDKEKLNRFGNGLNNMKRRMEVINGSFNITSNTGSAGTVTTIVLPL